MALIRCAGNRVSTQEIVLNYESGYVGWDATKWGEATIDLTKNICPLIVEMKATRYLGTATWAGNCHTKLQCYNPSTSTWEEIAMVKDKTQTIDVSDITKNKYYSKLKIRVGGTSSNGSVNHIGYAKIKRYFVR